MTDHTDGTAAAAKETSKNGAAKSTVTTAATTETAAAKSTDVAAIITVTAAVIIKDGLILAACRSGGNHLDGFFEFPGGKIEKGESPTACLKRELREEFNVECSIGGFICESIHHYDEKSIRLLGYYATHISGNFELHAHSEIKWLKREKLHELNWAPADLPILDLVKNSPIPEGNHSSGATTDSTAITNGNSGASFGGNSTASIGGSSTASIGGSNSLWYDENSAIYIDETANLDVKKLADKFATYVTNSSKDASTLKILDIGCGSGRDSLYFKELGFDVYPSDASDHICKTAGERTGLKIRCMKAQEVSELNTYNGIWCCASLLHIKKCEFPSTLLGLTDALIINGVLYMSFKYGTEERLDDKGRFFNDYDEESMKKELSLIKGIEILSMFQTDSPLRGLRQKWLNVYLKRNS